jgi:hypothetical protein
VRRKRRGGEVDREVEEDEEQEEEDQRETGDGCVWQHCKASS